ncbi:ATP-binding cassette domain-containing protein [Nocardioides daphniae]|uniref:ATP-binding cassette domain-containing protein n=1 Tax=Nocardioides daphniae TaxID=402297 RepID=A0A4P7UC41_9ACTN|nr:ATP-binding cassette domain-containing protein [Nocardioides daphniae]QCC76848.1 ATP-binding cassette domain-containing protein [Nocardioides daphniae]GGD17074.1 daunorubicin resistance protein DrrA family ABC transporter ATP-binding protein [Nocardioides daphniae]
MTDPSAGPAIQAIDLVKHYGDTVAVDGVSFSVPRGTVMGLLGPNGAGKTTTVRMMTTLTRPTSGTARVAGHDVVREPDAVRRSMGLTGQTATVDELLTGTENIELVGRLYGLDRATVRRIGADLLERFSLTDAAKRVVKTYSGGMRRRLDLAVSLVATPPVLFLDEPTTGLDPRSRVELWDVLRGLVDDGTTLLLTTQYLEEADQLADEIVVIDHGGIIAQGTPLQLKDDSGRAALVVTVSRAEDLERAEGLLRTVGSEVHVEAASRRLTSPAQGLGDVTAVAAAFEHSGIELDDLGLQRPSLDDVFLHLTGRRAEDDRNDGAPDDGPADRQSHLEAKR